MVQRRAARFACNSYSRQASVTEMLQKLGWRSLLQRRADIRLALLYKCLHGLVAVDLSQDLVRQTRQSRHSHPMALILPSETKLYLQQSFLPKTIAQWNSLPSSIALSPSIDAFKAGVSAITH